VKVGPYEERIKREQAMACALIQAKWDIHRLLVKTRSEEWEDDASRRDAHMMAGGILEALLIVQEHIAKTLPELSYVP
jgi:hypothetical protein